MEDRNVLDSLEAVEWVDSRMAPHMHWPFWRHAAFGGVEALLVLAVSLPISIGIAFIVIAVGGLSWIYHDDKKRYGMFVSGWQEGTKFITLAITVIVTGLLIFSMTRTGEPAPDPLALAASGSTFVAATLGSMLWERAYRRHLTRGRGR